MVKARCSREDFQKLRFLIQRQFIAFLGQLAEEHTKTASPSVAASGKTVPANTASLTAEERKAMADQIWGDIQKNKKRDRKTGP